MLAASRRRSRGGRAHGRGACVPGFALLAVLWVMIGLAALGLAVSLGARESVTSAHNRIALARASWQAEDCLERARAAVAEALAAPSALGQPDEKAWLSLEQVLGEAQLLQSAACTVELRAAGSAVDLNAADAGQLRRLFTAAGATPAAADSLTDALLDWRDADDSPRSHGAERSWYRAQGLHVPRNAPLADARELARVRGFAEVPGLDLETLLATEPGRIVLDRAPLPVLASLPGITGEVLARIAELRSRNEPVGELFELSAAVSPESQDSIRANYFALSGLTTTEPDAWILTSRGYAPFDLRGTAAPIATLEVRLVRAGTRAAIVRRRSWP